MKTATICYHCLFWFRIVRRLKRHFQNRWKVERFLELLFSIQSSWSIKLRQAYRRRFSLWSFLTWRSQWKCDPRSQWPLASFSSHKSCLLDMLSSLGGEPSRESTERLTILSCFEDTRPQCCSSTQKWTQDCCKTQSCSSGNQWYRPLLIWWILGLKFVEL